MPTCLKANKRSSYHLTYPLEDFQCTVLLETRWSYHEARGSGILRGGDSLAPVPLDLRARDGGPHTVVIYSITRNSNSVPSRYPMGHGVWSSVSCSSRPGLHPLFATPRWYRSIPFGSTTTTLKILAMPLVGCSPSSTGSRGRAINITLSDQQLKPAA